MINDVTLPAVVSPIESAPHCGLAFGVLHEAVKTIILCPNGPPLETPRARFRLKRALEVLEWADQQDRSFALWCEVADILPAWMSMQIKDLAEAKPLLMKIWKGPK